MTDQIFMPLLDEGTQVWRPVPAHKINDTTFIVLRPKDYDPDNETWEFPPGSTVVCEKRRLSDETVLAAAHLAEESTRRTA